MSPETHHPRTGEGSRGCRGAVRNMKPTTHTHTPHKTPPIAALQRKGGQREGQVYDTLLHPQISECYCAAAGCHIWQQYTNTHHPALSPLVSEHTQPIMKMSTEQQEICVHMERNWRKRSHTDKNRGNIWRTKPKNQPSPSFPATYTALIASV